MVTKHDLFEKIAENKSQLDTRVLVESFGKPRASYHNTYRMIQELLVANLIKKGNKGYELNDSKKAKLLQSIITYCLHNDINYNLLLDENVASFLSKAMTKKIFTAKHFDLHQATFRKYVDLLNRYGLLLTIQQKPFKGTILVNNLILKLLLYYNKPALAAKQSHVEINDQLKKEVSRFQRLLQKNRPRYERILEDIEIRFVHSSLSLEGNPITLPDTLKILKQHIIPKNLKVKDVEELQNYRKALDMMIRDAQQDRQLTITRILQYHRQGMQHENSMAGKYRYIPVRIKGNPKFKLAKPENIQKLLAELIKEYTEFMEKKKKSLDAVISFAAYFHNQFQFIHPFEDGNSRTTRLLTFHILQYHNIPMMDIPLGLMDVYLLQTKGYKVRRDEKLSEVLQLIVLYNLKAINSKLSS